MSGSNPFRRRERESGVSPPHPNSDAITRATTTASVATVENPPARTMPRSKIVRIASPPVPMSPTDPISSTIPTTSSPHLGPHRSPRSTERYDSSSDSQDDRTLSDPFEAQQLATDDDELDENSKNDTSRSSTTTDFSSDDDDGGSIRSSHFPSLPPSSQQHISRGPAIPSGATTESGDKGKGAMDVDAFTRLLLTGDSGTKPVTMTPDSPNASNKLLPKLAPVFASDSSSNTDTTSTSRQSISDYHRPVGADTPRTSHEMSVSEPDDEHRVRVDHYNSTGKKKPPPPKTRHGKLIKTDVNQTPSPQSTASHSRSNISLSYISQPQVTSPASPNITKTFASPSASDSFPTTPNDRTPHPEDSFKRKPSQSKRPPTPPLTRRHSQMKHVKSSASMSKPAQISISQTSIDSKSPSSPSPGVKNPPPPPSRRHGRTLSTQQSEASSSPGFPFPQASPSISSFPPGEENDSWGVFPGPSRTPSIRSVRRVSQPLGLSPSNMPPPPPPPPRRIRSPSRSSADSSRPRSPHLDKENGREDGPDAQPSNADSILADLTRLQREVDALRGRYESHKPSH